MSISYRNKFKVEQTKISHKTKHGTQIKLAKIEMIQALACYIIALLCIIGGVTLIIMGAAGVIEVGVELKGMKATLLNLSPGAFLFSVGMGVAWLGRYRFEHIQ
ncbi:hypothetical protein [Pseudomonas sp. TMP25]|uniref:hypothetical protein n=1 Tax=Pseudomonas sp. TMP25 TaxID=3136561 RepID=UPI003100DE75